VVAAFQAAGANATWLPPAPALSAVGVDDYNLASWGGNVTAFLTCSLDTRGPEFLGSCQPMPVACAVQTPASSDVPYACTRASDGSNVTGSLANATYRQECELPCDVQQDCNALCECWGACDAGTQYCACAACQALHPDAASDEQFFTIQSAAATSGAASATIIAGLAGAAAGRRRLAQAADVSTQLADVLVKVDSLRAAQSGITGQLDQLQSQVDRANLLAEARAASTTIQDLITGGGGWAAASAAGCARDSRGLHCARARAGRHDPASHVTPPTCFARFPHSHTHTHIHTHTHSSNTCTHDSRAAGHPGGAAGAAGQAGHAAAAPAGGHRRHGSRQQPACGAQGG
jgi:hypothetical protein